MPINHFGVAVDPLSGDVCFGSRYSGVNGSPGIFRLTPDTNMLGEGSTGPYVSLYDLKLDANGNVWATLQDGFGTGPSGVLRLNPGSDQLTAWSLPAASNPFRIVPKTPDEIWFTDYADAGNRIVRKRGLGDGI